jgi:hypothetical protein
MLPIFDATFEEMIGNALPIFRSIACFVDWPFYEVINFVTLLIPLRGDHGWHGNGMRRDRKKQEGRGKESEAKSLEKSKVIESRNYKPRRRHLLQCFGRKRSLLRFTAKNFKPDAA